MLTTQAQFLKSDLSWFESETYRSRYTTCVGNADNICAGYTHSCNSWQALQRDERGDWCLRHPSCRGSPTFPSSELLSSVASISQSRGQDHGGLRDELKAPSQMWVLLNKMCLCRQPEFTWKIASLLTMITLAIAYMLTWEGALQLHISCGSRCA